MLKRFTSWLKSQQQESPAASTPHPNKPNPSSSSQSTSQNSSQNTANEIRQNALRSYWKERAQQWWQNNQQRTSSAYCDSCNATLTPNNSYYLVGSNRMKCKSCTDTGLRDWIRNGGDAHWFGKNELENALLHYKEVNPVETNNLKNLLDLKPTTDLQQLITSLGDGTESVRQAAVKALSQLGEPAIEPLINALQSDKWRVNRGAAEALGQLRATRAIKPLTEAGLEGNPDAVTALGEIGGAAAAEAIASIFQKQSFTEKLFREAFIKLGKDAVEALIGVLQYPTPRSQLRSHAAYILKYIGDERAVEPLITLLKIRGEDNAHNALINTAATLGHLGDKRAVEPLIAFIQDETLLNSSDLVELWALKYAVAALGELQDTRAIEPLEACLQREVKLADEKADRDWREAIIKALKQIREQ